MIAILSLSVALAGPVPMMTGSLPKLTRPVPLFPEPTPLVVVPYRTATPWFWTPTAPVQPEPPDRAWPLLPAPSEERTAWQRGKTRIEDPGTFVPISELPSAFVPIQPAVDRLQRPATD